MTELYTAGRMRAVEHAAMQTKEVTGLELMERAGRGVVEAILEWRPELATTSHRAVVLCGPGNNGGDGFVVARLLKQRGWDVEVFLYGDEAKLPPDAAQNAGRWRELGPIFEVADAIDTIEGLSTKDLVIDAIFGSGLSRPFDDCKHIQLLINSCASCWHIGTTPAVVAIDVPTGLCSDSGRYLGDKDASVSVRASLSVAFEGPKSNLTVTFHRPYVGHFLADGPEACGKVVCKSISLDDISKIRRHQNIGASYGSAEVLEPPDWQFRAVNPTGHKYCHGHALILSGGPGAGGAARLAARAALRVGAGLVTLGCPPEAVTENAARMDAVMLAQLKNTAALEAVLKARKINTVCIGPGFETGKRLRDFTECILSQRGPDRPVNFGTFDASTWNGGGGDWSFVPGEPLVSVVLDADALTEYRDDPETLFGMLHHRCILTPHEGEFGRLFPDILARLKEPAIKGPAYSKVDATQDASKRAGCTVLFKGPDTVIVDWGDAAISSAQYERAAPWLATAGSGDVLAGMITGLLAQTPSTANAAKIAAWLHVECALKFGPGLIAEDLPEQLPAVFRDLGL